MRIVRNIVVPTGNILIVEGEKGLLECLSLGDYGKDINLNQNKPVIHTKLLPLEKKWVITISTQYGCSIGCSFCDVPRVGAGRNASFADLTNQIAVARGLHPEVTCGERLNIHFARMGEPTWNWNVLSASTHIYKALGQCYTVHPVVSTMMPRHNRHLSAFLKEWMRIKNDIYDGEAGLQLSINSTNESEREVMFHGNAVSLADIGHVVADLPKPVGRKITLNFAVAEWEIDPSKLLRYFAPDYFVVKLTPMHRTATAEETGIRTRGDYTQPYPYEHNAAALRAVGYDVLVFIASREEDEGRITCGNAILSGTEPFLMPSKVQA